MDKDKSWTWEEEEKIPPKCERGQPMHWDEETKQWRCYNCESVEEDAIARYNKKQQVLRRYKENPNDPTIKKEMEGYIKQAEVVEKILKNINKPTENVILGGYEMRRWVDLNIEKAKEYHKVKEYEDVKNT